MSSVLVLSRFCFGTDLWISLCRNCGYPVDNLAGGGVVSVACACVASQTQKKVISVLFQLLDPPHVFITVLHKSTIRVECLLCSPYFISRIGRAGWLSSLFF